MYQRNSNPILVDEFLWPLRALFVRAEEAPCMTASVVHDESPARVVCEGDVARDWDIQRTVHGDTTRTTLHDHSS